jgi:hypothetical protein
MPSSKKYPAVIGGTIGGVVVVVLAMLYYRQRRQRRKQPRTKVDPEPMEPSFQPTPFVTNRLLQVDGSRDFSPSSLLPERTDLHASDISSSPMSPENIMSSAANHVPTSPVVAASTSQYTLSRTPLWPEETTSHTFIPPSAVMPMDTSSPTGSHPNDEASEIIPRLQTSLPPEDINLETNNISSSPIPPKSGVSQIPASSVVQSQYSSPNQPPQAAEAAVVGQAFSATSPVGTSSPMGSRLSNEQSELVQGLIKHSVPLPAVVAAI